MTHPISPTRMTPLKPTRMAASAWTLRCTTWALCLAAGGSAWAGSIFTCVDSKGNRYTSDRPIAACMDREQRELNSNGTLKRLVPPSYTAQERAEAEAKQQAEAAEQTRLKEEKRRKRALLTRYPNQAAHDRVRADALEQADAVIEAVNAHGEQLDKQRAKIDDELQFYKNDMSKAPAWLMRQRKDNNEQRQKQSQELQAKEAERAALVQRYDQELAELKTLWQQDKP